MPIKEAMFAEISKVKNILHLRGLIDEFIQENPTITSFSYIVSHFAENPGRPHVISHYPIEWVKLYQQKNYVMIDPVVQDILTSHAPFVWDYQIYLSRINENQAELFNDSRNCGVTAGITCPLHGPLGEFGGVFFAVENIDDFMQQKHQVNQWDLMSLALIYHEVARKLLIKKAPFRKPLTARETECLIWSSRGKTAYEISIILGISERTIHGYLNSCLEKLEANNKVQAVTKAILQGDLFYQDIDWNKTNVM